MNTTDTSPYSNGKCWPALSLKYTGTSSNLSVFMGRKMRFDKSKVSMASVELFFTAIDLRRYAPICLLP